MNLWKFFLVGEPAFLGFAYVIGGQDIVTFISFAVGMQFLLLWVVLTNKAIELDAYLQSAKSKALLLAGVVLGFGGAIVWAMAISPWLFTVWTKNAGIEAEAEPVSYNIMRHSGRRDYAVKDIGFETTLHVKVRYYGHEGTISTSDIDTEVTWYKAIQSGDRLRVYFLPRYPSIVFANSQLGLEGSDVIDIHTPAKTNTYTPSPTGEADPCAIACFYDKNAE